MLPIKKLRKLRFDLQIHNFSKTREIVKIILITTNASLGISPKNFIPVGCSARLAQFSGKRTKLTFFCSPT